MNNPGKEQQVGLALEIKISQAESRTAKAEMKARDAEALAAQAEIRAIHAEMKLQEILHSRAWRIASTFRKIGNYFTKKLHLHGIKKRILRVWRYAQKILARLHIIGANADNFDKLFFRNSELFTKELQQRNRRNKSAGNFNLICGNVPNNRPAIEAEVILKRIKSSRTFVGN